MINKHAHKHIDRIRFPPNHGKDYIIERGTYTKMAYGMLGGNWQNAEDCIQEAYLKVLLHPPNYIGDKEFEYYFTTVVRSVAIDMLRSDRKKEISCNSNEQIFPQYLEISVDAENRERNEVIALADANADPAEIALGSELLEYIKEEIGKIPWKYRNNVFLYTIYGYRPRDVCSITGDSIKKVYNSIQYFRKHMEGGL